MNTLPSVTNLVAGVGQSINVGIPPSAAVVVLGNLSAYSIAVTTGGGSTTLQPWTADRLDTGQISGFNGTVTVTPAPLLGGVSTGGSITVNVYGSGEPVNVGYPMPLSPLVPGSQQRVISVPLPIPHATSSGYGDVWEPATPPNRKVLSFRTSSTIGSLAFLSLYLPYCEIGPGLSSANWTGAGYADISLVTYGGSALLTPVNGPRILARRAVWFNPGTMQGQSWCLPPWMECPIDIVTGSPTYYVVALQVNNPSSASLIPLTISFADAFDLNNATFVPGIGPSAGVY